ncbi:MAG TPA: YceH family protein, partial [Candidatus Baltobacteraceae bacterium]|nr:YceH family protein [Candidatus Baltobacteraceae bacterium]
MAPQLSQIEARVLGALVEKETTTPEYYPLSLNALVNACNQKSNRDPVMTLGEEAVRQALRSLSDQAMVRSAGGDSRVAKFEHRLNELYNFHRHEIAVLCVLLLRGPQTPGELRTRAERMYAFEDLEAVHAALNLLLRRDPPLVKILPRQPGTKESRYMHLFSGDVIPGEHAAKELSAETETAGKTTQDGDRVT